MYETSVLKKMQVLQKSFVQLGNNTLFTVFLLLKARTKILVVYTSAFNISHLAKWSENVNKHI